MTTDALSETTYYDILDIAPDASPLDIRQAFQEQFELYRPESLASYSFFSETQRQEILRDLEEAYHELIDQEARAAYDEGLVQRGLLTEEQRYVNKAKAPIPLYGYPRGSQTQPQPRPPSSTARDPQEVQRRLLSRESIAGQDLREARIALGYTLEQISRETKIKTEILRAIEEDDGERLPPPVYVRGFVRQYTRVLGLDDSLVPQAYLNP